ncbi:hypothetical protein [Yaniella flava]
MRKVSSVVLRTSAIVLAAGLSLAGCSSEAYENQPGGVGLLVNTTTD